MKKQSAIEWLFEQMYKEPRSEYSFAITGCKVDKMFNQAIAMEKEQIMKFAKTCLDKALDLDIRTAHSQVEKYYNETYG